MKNFGCLKDVSFNKSNEKELIEILLKEGLFEMKRIASGNSSNINDGILELRMNPEKVIVEPSKDLIDEFYSFIMNEVFKHYILEHKLQFFNIFNDQIYGLDYSEQKKIGLHHFKNIYKENYLDVITPFEDTVSETGIIHSNNFGRLQMLYYQLNAFKNNLADKIKLNNYLIGDKEFFKKENLSEKYGINDELQFEICVQILVELNDRYQFEDDYYFTNRKNDRAKFKEYDHIFKSLESYQFTDRKIISFKEDEKAKSVSLYQALINKDLITENKEAFKRFMKAEYNFSPSEIVTYEKDINRTHDKRVAQFTDDWEKFDVKN